MDSEDVASLEESDSCSWMDMSERSDAVGSGSKGNGKRRFSDDQIKLLDSMFQTQTKLEPRQKLQLAKEIGLQPRQVAIWFQNKRARWKSKQQEREYNSLRANYESLLSSFESLKKEKQVLLKQQEKLKQQLVGKAQERESQSRISIHEKAGGIANVEETEIRVKGEKDDTTNSIKKDEFTSFGTEEELFAEQLADSSTLTSQAADQIFYFHTSWPPPAFQACSSNSSSQWWEFYG